MKFIVIPLLALAIASPAAAFETDNLLALVAMPLAVAAVADVADVPARDVVNLVSALNRANVPAPQFVEVVRYAPIAIVDTTYDPPFVSYVTTRVDDGLVGDALVLDIQDRYRPYGFTQFDYAAPRLVVVENRPVLPELVVNRFGLDPLALVAMPLAVAAVSELTNVPMQDFISLLAAMNRADVPPVQFVELVRYSPVVLLDDGLRPEFIRYLSTDDLRDLQRDAYALALAQRLRTYGADDLDVRRVREVVYVTDRQLLPDVVRNHPHGGPPGQIKKQLGLQTGAEVVHGEHPGRGRDDDDRVPARVVDRSRDRDDDDRDRGSRGRSVDRKNDDDRPRGRSVDARRADPGPPAKVENRGRGNSNRADASRGNPGKGKGNGNGQGKNKGKG